MRSSRLLSLCLVASATMMAATPAASARSGRAMNQYVAAEFGGAHQPDVRVLALSDGTDVIVGGVQMATLRAGESYLFVLSALTVIETSAPAAVFEHVNAFDGERDVALLAPLVEARQSQAVAAQVVGPTGAACVLVQSCDVAHLTLDGQAVTPSRRATVPGLPAWTALWFDALPAGKHLLRAPSAMQVALISGDKSLQGSFANLTAASRAATHEIFGRYAQGSCQQDADCGTFQWCESDRAMCRVLLEAGEPLPASGLGRASIGGNCTTATASACVSGACNALTHTCALPNAEPCSSAALCVSNVCATDNHCGLQDLMTCTSDSVCRSGSCSEGYCQSADGKIEGSGLLDSCNAAPGAGADARGALVLVGLLACLVWRRRRRQVALSVILMWGTLSAPARSQAADAGFALERVTLAPANSRWFAADSLVSGPAASNPIWGIGKNTFALRLDGAWAHQPLVMKVDGATLVNVVEDDVALTLHAAWNPVRQLRLDLDFPLQVYAQGALAAGGGSVVLPAADDVAAGDLAAAATYVIDTPAKDALRFGVTLRFRFPTGEQDDYMSDGTTSGAVLVAMAGDVGCLAYALDVGGRLRTKQPFAGDTIGSEVTAVPAIGLQNLDRTLLVGLEVPMAVDVVAAQPFSQAGFAADPLLGVHWWPVPQLGLRAGAGTSLTTAVGEARWRLLVGLQYFPLIETEKPLPPPPPPAPPPPPPPDSDGDSVPDPDDHCPHGEPGNPNLLGCFAVDTDGDGVIDPDDRCPQEAGTAEYQGCPPPTKVVVQEDRITVNEKIEFEVNKDTLKPDSLPTLDDIVKVMQTHAQIKALQVQGHTDTSGNAKKNRVLSEKRAAAVVRYLVEHGVAAERLQAKGFGSDQPLVPNDTPAHRSTNRRVDFIIVSGAGTPSPKAAPATDAPQEKATDPANSTPPTAAPAPQAVPAPPATPSGSTPHAAPAPAAVPPPPASPSGSESPADPPSPPASAPSIDAAPPADTDSAPKD